MYIPSDKDEACVLPRLQYHYDLKLFWFPRGICVLILLNLIGQFMFTDLVANGHWVFIGVGHFLLVVRPASVCHHSIVVDNKEK